MQYAYTFVAISYFTTCAHLHPLHNWALKAVESCTLRPLLSSTQVPFSKLIWMRCSYKTTSFPLNMWNMSPKHGRDHCFCCCFSSYWPCCSLHTEPFSSVIGNLCIDFPLWLLLDYFPWDLWATLAVLSLHILFLDIHEKVLAIADIMVRTMNFSAPEWDKAWSRLWAIFQLLARILTIFDNKYRI